MVGLGPPVIPVTYQRLLSRGDYRDSAGGLYNPGAYQHPDGQILMAIRHEVDYTWTKPAQVKLVEFAADFTRLWSDTLPVRGHDTDARIEDVRPFVFGPDVLMAHTRWKPHDRSYPIRPVLSRLAVNMAETPWVWLERYDDWSLPLVPQPVEKNWVLLEKDGELYTVYSLDPLVIFRRHREQGTAARPDGWVLYNSSPNGWASALGKPPRNSTHLLPFAGGYLGWWHVILDQSYVHGAYWLDADLQLRARTGVLFDGSWVRGDVYKEGVMYVSSQLVQDERILLFYGEGDAHAGVATLRTDDVREALRLR